VRPEVWVISFGAFVTSFEDSIRPPEPGYPGTLV
jgi:hypothetical protein